MSYVDNFTKSYSIKEVLKLLDNPVEWRLENRGTCTEQFIHNSGWRFYTGLDIITLRKDDYVLDVGFIRCMLFIFTKKEKKFVEKWLKLQEE